MWGKAGFVTEPAIRGQFGFEHLHISAETLGSPIEGSFVLFRGSPLVVVRLAVAVAWSVASDNAEDETDADSDDAANDDIDDQKPVGSSAQETAQN